MADSRDRRAEALKRIEDAAQTRATELDFIGMGLTELPPDIGELTNLTTLFLHNNQLTSLPPEIGKLTNLTALVLMDNQLTALPPEIGKLTNLTTLFLHNNQLTSLPPEIGKLTNLTELYLHNNQLTALPPEIGKLTNLTELSLHNNQLTSLPPEIWKLTNLTTLYLRNNQLTSLPPEIVNLNLEFVWKESYAGDVKGINLHNNPLESPPVEIVRRGREAVNNYFESIREKDATTKLYEAKLLVVGQGDVGKTWLLNRLMTGKTPRTTTTEGIEIHEWHVETPGIKDFRVNFWDFGGQEIYHATHQFFLTKRSLYLFVWEVRKEEEILSFDYWLNAINILSDNAPVIVAMNKCDERTKEIDEKTIRDKFTNIKGFFKVSALRGDGTEDLGRKIVEEIDRLPQVGDVLPVVWMEIRKELEGLPDNYITFERYLKICKEHGLNEDKAEHLAQYYHDLGVFLNFETPPILKTFVFLKPDWATGAVYKLLDTRTIIDAQGFFRHEQLRDIWAQYPPDIHLHLLELMKKFELVFELPNNRGYIVPELLAPGLPKNVSWDGSENLKFEYRYAFMPAGIITRFIVRTHRMHKDEMYWKNGVVLEWDGTRAQVICEPLNRRIVISIRGRDKKGLLAIIRKEIQEIHETLNNPELRELLFCICDECKTSDEPKWFDYKDVVRAMDKKQAAIQCLNSYGMISIRDLLGEYGIIEEAARNIEIKEIHVGDKFQIQGQIVAAGRGAKAEGNTVQQIQINIDGKTVDQKTLIDELSKLWTYLDQHASDDEQYDEVNKISKARKAAEAGDGGKVANILKSLGTWTGKAITDIGTKVIASIIFRDMSH